MPREMPGERVDDTAAATSPAPPGRGDSKIRFHDRVRVPDGRIGNVVGFYRTRSEMALVRFGDESRKFVLRELELVTRAR